MPLMGEEILGQWDLMMSQTDLHLTQHVHDELKNIRRQSVAIGLKPTL